MGIIYPWSAVASGLIPSTDAYPRLAARMTETLREAPCVLAGSVFGSATRGDYTRRSDLDAFYVFPDHKVDEARRLRRRLRAMALREHVVLNLRTHSLSEARAGGHCFGPSYSDTWTWLHDHGWMVGHPHWFYDTAYPGQVATEMERKIRRYHLRARNFLPRLEVAGSRRGGWERLLERCHVMNVRPAHTYIAVARMFLRWRDGRLDDDGQGTVIRRAFAAVGFAPLLSLSMQIRNLNRAYDSLLTQVLRDELSERAYRITAREIFAAIAVRNVELLTAARRVFVRPLVVSSAA